MRRAFALFLLVITLILQGPTARAGEPFVILLDWFINPDHAPLIVAAEKGFFVEEGLAVEFIEPADPNMPPRLLAAGEGDLAISYQPQLYLQAAAGLPVVRIATLVATPLNSIVVLADSGIESPADLDGATIGYSVGGFEELLLARVLESYGLTLKAVRLVNVNFALSPSLLSGQVDAVIGAFRNFELNQLDLEGHKGRAFYLEEHGVPVYDELILLARKSDLEEEKLKAFLRALERGVLYLINHPEESWELYIGHKRGLDTPLDKLAFRDTLARFALRPAALDRSRYEAFADFVLQSGLVDSLPPLADYAVEIGTR